MLGFLLCTKLISTGPGTRLGQTSLMIIALDYVTKGADTQTESANFSAAHRKLFERGIFL